MSIKKLSLVLGFLFISLTTSATPQSDLCQGASEIVAANKQPSNPAEALLFAQWKPFFEKLNENCGNNTSAKSNPTPTQIKSKIKLDIQKFGSPKVFDLVNSLKSAKNTQSYHESLYKLCMIQLSWEMSWSRLTESQIPYYDYDVKPLIDSVLKDKHNQCLAFISQKSINNLASSLGVEPFNRKKKHSTIYPKYPNGYEDGEGYLPERKEEKIATTNNSESDLKKFTPLIQFCDMKKTVYEKKKCEEKIHIKEHFIMDGVVSNIISKNKFILRLASDQYANIYGDFDERSMKKLISFSNTGEKISFVGELKALGTGIVIYHDFNYLNSVN